MQRYFIDSHITDTTVHLDDTMMHHLNRVLRLKQTTTVCVVDASSRVFEVSVEPNQEVGTILNEINQKEDFPIDLTLAVALLKKDKFEWVIQKATELGATRILPFVSERTIIDLDAKDFEKKRARYQTIAKEASEQSHRKHVCQIEALHTFKQVCHRYAAFKGLCFERVEHESVSLHACKHLDSLMVIGPEGGFSHQEVELARFHGFKLISLGHRILRAETAAIAICAMIEAYHDQ